MRLLAIIFLFISTNSFAQWKDYIISVRGDTLNRIDMQGKKQGPWVINVPELRGNEGYDEQGHFEDDKKEGKWIRFSITGDKIAEENFLYGVLDGKSRYYTRNGGLLREESWRAVEPGKNFDTIKVYDINDPTVIDKTVIVKVEDQTYKHGIWTYYEPVWGTIEKTEKYFADQLQTDVDEMNATGDEEIKPLATSKGKTDTTDKKEKQKPATVLQYEKKNAGKKKIKVQDGSTGL